jgi:histidinol-phosphate aminotransferase
VIYRKCFQHLHKIDRKRIPATPEGDLRLHRLERPHPWNDDLLAEMWTMPPNTANHYPDYAMFSKNVAWFFGVKPEQIVLGQGIEDHIRSLFMLCCDPGDIVAYTWPTCAMFDIYAEVFGARPVRIKPHPRKRIAWDEFCAVIPDATRLVILPNPGQPVDDCYQIDELHSIAAHCRKIGAVLAIDEAYHWFGSPSALPLIHEFNNVLVLRTFSKAFGGAALRVGVAIGSETAIRPLNAARPSGEISGPSIHAVNVLIKRWFTDVVPGIREVCEGRDWLRDKLSALGYVARGSNANHVLVELPTAPKMQAVMRRLKLNRVHVKGDYPAPLDRHLLITAAPQPIMEQFLAKFKEACVD